jgi:hypothetical protein
MYIGKYNTLQMGEYSPNAEFEGVGSHDTMLAPLHSHQKYGFG